MKKFILLICVITTLFFSSCSNSNAKHDDVEFVYKNISLVSGMTIDYLKEVNKKEGKETVLNITPQLAANIAYYAIKEAKGEDFVNENQYIKVFDFPNDNEELNRTHFTNYGQYYQVSFNPSESYTDGWSVFISKENGAVLLISATA